MAGTPCDEVRHSSDFLESRPIGEPRLPCGDHVQLVSLGCSCGPKLTFRSLGHGAESLPFDWVRSRACGIVHFLRSDFADFYEFFTRAAVPDSAMTMYRSFLHSFWHDNPNDPAMREKYARRIERFRQLGADGRRLLFVRSAASTDELWETQELIRELAARFGPTVRLLLVVDFQQMLQGPALVEGLEDQLLVYFLEAGAHRFADGTPSHAPYEEPVRCAVEWASGSVLEAEVFADLRELATSAEETHWGLNGPGALRSFEERPEGPPEAPVDELRPGSGPWPAEVPALTASVLEPQGGAAEDSPIRLVPLGCDCGPKRTLVAMGFGSEALPFDWIQVSLEGLLHFMGPGGTDFEDFFEYTTKKPVPGTSLTMYRSTYHSFWNDCPESEVTRAEYAARIVRFRGLAATDGGERLLFVRAVASTEELSGAAELLGALVERFGSRAALLLIADFQQRSEGPFTVEGCEGLLVYFLDAAAHCGSSRDAPYRKPIMAALDALRGEQPGAPPVAPPLAGLAAAAARAAPTRWGLVGPGGLRAFEPPGGPKVARRPPTEEELRIMAEIAAGAYPMMGSRASA